MPPNFDRDADRDANHDSKRDFKRDPERASKRDSDCQGLRSRFVEALDAKAAHADDAHAATFDDIARTAALTRWDAHAPRLLATLRTLYADYPRYDEVLELFVRWMAGCIVSRPAALRALDAAREAQADWFLGNDMLAYSAYVDRFGGDLRGVASRVPYLQALGVRYLHLLPFLRARAGDNDGGFAVSDYDVVEPALGTIADLEALTARLRAAGISLCADLVLNHTADDHRWAQAARRGDPYYRDYYHVFADSNGPEAYAHSLRDVFPQTAPGNFTEVPGLGWVWTTFYPYQWDLNWANPDVFAHMALSLLRLANLGVEAFRLDSTAYLWKRVGTDCMNQPEAHLILQALRAVIDIAAPGLLLKAEAIVPTRELSPYFGRDDARECHLAYHSSLMAALWAGMAERRGDIVARVLEDTPALPAACGWLGYLRCHDDIGWTVLAQEAAGDTQRGAYDLAAIAAFFAGETAESYARGRRFQSVGGDHVHGSNGMGAALAGIQTALATGDAAALARAERRFVLLHAVVLACTGLPTLYMGDEIALGNDEGYLRDPLRAQEGRWLHRPGMEWALALAASEALESDIDTSTTTVACARRVYAALRALLRARRALPALRGDAALRVLSSPHPELLCVMRGMGDEAREDGVFAIFNFGEHAVDAPTWPSGVWQDVLDSGIVSEDRPCGLIRDRSATGPRIAAAPASLPAHGFIWLQRARISDQTGAQTPGTP